MCENNVLVLGKEYAFLSRRSRKQKLRLNCLINSEKPLTHFRWPCATSCEWRYSRASAICFSYVEHRQIIADHIKNRNAETDPNKYFSLRNCTLPPLYEFPQIYFHPWCDKARKIIIWEDLIFQAKERQEIWMRKSTPLKARLIVNLFDVKIQAMNAWI